MRGWPDIQLIGACGVLAACLSGCAPAPDPQVAAPIAAPAGPPPPAGVIAGTLGASLSEQDRQTAFNTQEAALDSGQKKSWKGQNGAFGFIEPGAENGGCRDYTHTVFIDGRAKNGKGNACRLADGGWKW